MSPDTTIPVDRGQRRVDTWRIEVTAGASRGVALRRTEGIVRVGSADDNDVVVRDGKVSRHHLELEVSATGVRVRDLGSKNSTYFQSSRVVEAALPIAGGALFLGDSEISVSPDDAPIPMERSTRERVGRLRGRTAPMQRLFTEIERVARAEATVLVHGETGSGKELVAEALHELGPRKDGPFVVLDCGAVARELVESEIFGHVRGAFTGAVSDRAGAFERAHGGTLFLDEMGELPLELQPKLLRVLETRQFTPVGGVVAQQADVRVVAASNRDLAQQSAAGRFRRDLYFRLSVIVLRVPPLREHREDIPLLAEHFLDDLDAPPLGPEALEVLTACEWPGNVRQLRNVLERAAALSGGGALSIRRDDIGAPSARSSPSELLRLPWKDAKDELLARFSHDYLVALLDRNGGNVSAASREAGIDRNWIVALARRHGVRVRD